MKRFLYWSVVPVLGVLAAVGIALNHRAKPEKPEPCIVFLLQHDTGANSTGVSAGTLPVELGYNRRNNWGESNPDSGVTNHFDESETVIVDGENKFALAIHCLVNRNGETSDLTKTITVLPHKPAKPEWSQLNSHVAACAYLDVATTN